MWQQQCEWNKSALGEGDRRHAASEKLVSRMTKARGQFSHSSAPRQKAAGLKLTHFKTVRERGSGASHSLNYLTVWLREHSELNSVQPSLKKKKRRGIEGGSWLLTEENRTRCIKQFFPILFPLLKNGPARHLPWRLGWWVEITLKVRVAYIRKVAFHRTFAIDMLGKCQTCGRTGEYLHDTLIRNSLVYQITKAWLILKPKPTHS